MVGDSEGTHRFAVRFQDIDASKGLRLIAPTLEFMHSLHLLFWGVPNFSVHTRGFLALVFRHPSNGENFAAVRVGQQALQGSHLAPSAFFLHRLHDTHLESANIAVDGLRQSMAYHSPLRLRPHQQFALSSSSLPHKPIYQVFSCKAPQGSLLTFAPGNVVRLADAIPVSAPLQSSLRFLPDLLSAPPWVHLARDFPPIREERCGFTLFRGKDTVG